MKVVLYPLYQVFTTCAAKITIGSTEFFIFTLEVHSLTNLSLSVRSFPFCLNN